VIRLLGCEVVKFEVSHFFCLQQGYLEECEVTSGCFLPSDSSLLSHGGKDGDNNVFTILESLLNLLSNVRVGNLDVVLRGTVVGHQVEETVVDYQSSIVSVSLSRSLSLESD